MRSPVFPLCGIKFHLQNKLPQAICAHNNKAGLVCQISEIVTEVAGRVCALPIEAGASVGDGDDIAFVESMKMEIPVAAPAAGKVKSILVALDDVVAEGQAVAIIETDDRSPVTAIRLRIVTQARKTRCAA